jgi:hypothetical protein
MVTVIIGGERHEVKGRLADMITWLVRRANDIQAGSSGVRFSFRGPRLTAVIEHEETINN